MIPDRGAGNRRRRVDAGRHRVSGDPLDGGLRGGLRGSIGTDGVWQARLVVGDRFAGEDRRFSWTKADLYNPWRFKSCSE